MSVTWTKSDNGSEIPWDSADRYCRDLTLGGYSGWRLPAIEELKGIYDPKTVSGKVRLGDEVLDIHTTSGFRLSTYDVWSGKWQGLDAVGFFRFNDGEKFCVRREKMNAYNMTALCVRSSGQ